ncbi:AraC family transcriptional regulator [Enterococcus saccharolyticus]|uniref:AraC family transcriptional regulator n=1 Tax=Enterococcus TaxID=1350 RepID=UPI001E3D14CE|nr:AraC family transcriptional regulator [Enterococcus saccharolyticus]MCD5001901.1 AraC family transcriptional regulator [Enterococcus saccharolyticus]
MKIRHFLPRKFLFKKKTFYRYVFSYLLVFLLPFSIVSIIWYKTSTDSINNQIDLSAQNHLLQVKSIMSANLRQLDYLTDQISNNPLLSEKMFEHPYYSLEASKELLRNKVNSNIIEELYVYYYNQPEKVYSSNGLLDLPTFIQRRYGTFDFDEAALKQSLNTKAPLIERVPAGKKSGVGLMTYIVPLSATDGLPSGVVMYTMRMSDIQNFLDKSVDRETGNVFMVDSENRLLVASHDDEIPAFMNQPSEVEKLYQQHSRKTKEGTLLVNTSEDQDFGIRYIALTNTEVALSEVRTIHYRLMALVLSILALGLAIVFFIGRRQYKPIHELEKLMEKQLGGVREAEELDDFVRMEQHVTSFLKQNKELHQEIRRQTPHAREQVLRKLLMGRFKDEKEVQLLLDSVEIQLYKERYFVMLIDTKMITTETSIQNQEFLMSFLGEISGNGYRAYGSELLSNQAIALLVSLDGSVGLTMIVREIVAGIVLENTVAPTIGVGSVVDALVTINRSYIEGLAALEYQAVSDKPNQILFFNEIKNEKKNSVVSYPADEQLKLSQSLQQGDFEIASETIGLMVRKGMQEQRTIAGMKLYSYYLLNSVVKVGAEVIGDTFFQEAEKAVEFRNLIELQNELIKMSEKICLAVQRNPKNQESKLQKDIFVYLDANYASHEFSLESVAEEFDVSISYLSRFIKKESGMTFSKYVQEKRLAKIKKELRETDQPIKEIILNAGYYDVSNYTRKFKQIVGMTPGQYRNKNR